MNCISLYRMYTMYMNFRVFYLIFILFLYTNYKNIYVQGVHNLWKTAPNLLNGNKFREIERLCYLCTYSCTNVHDFLKNYVQDLVIYYKSQDLSHEMYMIWLNPVHDYWRGLLPRPRRLTPTPISRVIELWQK